MSSDKPAHNAESFPIVNNKAAVMDQQATPLIYACIPFYMCANNLLSVATDQSINRQRGQASEDSNLYN